VTVLQCREGPIPPNPSSDADPSSRPFARAVIRRNIWYYRDRTGLPRGPMTVDVLRKAYIGGIIDGNTLMWGNGLGHWVPLRNIRGMDGNLTNPKVLFLKWIHNTFIITKAQRQERRDELYRQGLAKSPVMNHDEVRDWKKTREEKLRSGEEALMLSLTLAMPLGKEIGSLGAKMKKAFRGKKVEKKEEEEGVISA